MKLRSQSSLEVKTRLQLDSTTTKGWEISISFPIISPVVSTQRNKVKVRSPLFRTVSVIEMDKQAKKQQFATNILMNRVAWVLVSLI